MHMIRRLVIWFWRAWPIIVMSLLVGAHILAISKFPTATVFVNKLTGIFMQIVGGLIVLHSVDSNLGLFRNQSLATTVISWFRECPIFKRSINCTANFNTAGAHSSVGFVTVTRAATTIEERLAEAERRIDELRSEIAVQHKAIYTRVEAIKADLSNSIASNQSALNKLSEQVERATVGGFKQQSFGVMLVIYGAAISVYA